MKILYATLLLAGISLGTQAQQFRFENPKLHPSLSHEYDDDLYDPVSHIAADANDNLYLAYGNNTANFGGGYQMNGYGGTDYGAVSLNPDQTQRWIRVNGGYSYDEAFDGFADPNGTYYSCGIYRSTGPAPMIGPSTIVHPGAVVVKYLPSGTIAWASGLGTVAATDNDRATCLTKNQFGQMWTFGTIDNSRGIFMKRLDTATGAVIKSVMPTGQNNQISSVLDAITLADGSTIICGESRSPNVLGYPISAPDQEHWGMMARIDTAGNVLWVNKFGASGYGFKMAHDGSGNVLVVIRFSAGGDSVTTEPYVLRVNPSGAVLNQYRTYSRITPPGYAKQAAQPSIAAQANGSFAVSFYTSDQRLLAPHDSIFLGGGARNGVVEFFSAAGAIQQILAIRSFGANSVALPSSITALSGGRYALTGTMKERCGFGYGQFITTPRFSDLDIFTTIISTTPPPVPTSWPLTFGSTQNDIVRGVVRDAQGNVYISMAFRGTITLGTAVLSSYSEDHKDMALAKFDENGYLEWVQNMGNSTFEMEPQGVNVDAAGNPYWAGSFAGTVFFNTQAGRTGIIPNGAYDAFVARFDPISGIIKWIKLVGGAGSDYLYGCFVSNSGNVYAGGSYTGAISFSTLGGSVALANAGGLDGFIVKLDNAGNGIYASRMGSSSNDEVKSIEYNGGDLVACGYMGNNCSFPGVSSTITLPSINASKDGWMARINSEGKYVWVKNFGSGNGDEAMAICLNPTSGDVFAAIQLGGAMTFNGTTHPHKGHNDIGMVGYNFYTQAPRWSSQVGSGSSDIPFALKWDGQRLVVGGHSSGTFTPGAGVTLTGQGGKDGVLLRYNPSNGVVTSGQIIGGTGEDQVNTLWCNTSTREAFVGGYFSASATLPASAPRVSNGGFDGFVARVTPPAGAREGEEASFTSSTSGLNVYPVPASKELRFELEDESAQTRVVDAKGTLVQVPMRQEGTEAILDVAALKPGIYLIRTGERSARFVKE